MYFANGNFTYTKPYESYKQQTYFCTVFCNPSFYRPLITKYSPGKYAYCKLYNWIIATGYKKINTEKLEKSFHYKSNPSLKSNTNSLGLKYCYYLPKRSMVNYNKISFITTDYKEVNREKL